jgi:hypothetical protein
MELAIGVTIHLLHVFGDANTELVEVEVSVAGDQRIVGPVDYRAAERAYGVPLVLLEHAADSEIARVLANSEHVGPVDDAAALDAGEPEDEAEQPAVAIECPGRDAAHALADLEDARRHEVGELVAPRRALKVDAGQQLLGGPQRANVYTPRARRGERGRGS